MPPRDPWIPLPTPRLRAVGTELAQGWWGLKGEAHASAEVLWFSKCLPAPQKLRVSLRLLLLCCGINEIMW